MGLGSSPKQSTLPLWQCVELEVVKDAENTEGSIQNRTRTRIYCDDVRSQRACVSSLVSP